MKKLLVLPLLLLSGCAIHAVPVTYKFPDAPETLKEKCVPLKEATPDMDVVAFTKLVVTNTVEYHICSRKVDGWIEWHIKQTKIAEDATKK